MARRPPPALGGPGLQRGSIRAGNGQQWASWVGRDELAFIIEFALATETLTGPVNAVSPNPLRNAEFVTTTAKALGTKSVGSMPAFLVRLVMGEMGEEFLLASRRIQPAKLLASGYQFRFPELEQALQHEMGKMNASFASQPVDELQP